MELELFVNINSTKLKKCITLRIRYCNRYVYVTYERTLLFDTIKKHVLGKRMEQINTSSAYSLVCDS